MDEQKKGLTKSGYKRIVTVYIIALLQIAIFFTAAGRLDLPRAWLYYGFSIGAVLVNTILGSILSPEIANIRGDLIKKDTKSWDIVFIALYSSMMFVGPAVAGIDVGRFIWSDISIYWAIIGTAIFIISILITDWAMMTNTHFETSVRIQKDREHKVVSTGPYKIVRHPGYVGMILMNLSFPLIIGSIYAWIPIGITILLLFARTALEDKTLRNELDGYLDYSTKVKYRLIPGIW